MKKKSKKKKRKLKTRKKENVAYYYLLLNAQYNMEYEMLPFLFREKSTISLDNEFPFNLLHIDNVLAVGLSLHSL